MLQQRDGDKIKPLDVDGIYEALVDKMVQVVNRAGNNSVDNNQGALWLVREIEKEVIKKVQIINTVEEKDLHAECVAIKTANKFERLRLEAENEARKEIENQLKMQKSMNRKFVKNGRIQQLRSEKPEMVKKVEENVIPPEQADFLKYMGTLDLNQLGQK